MSEIIPEAFVPRRKLYRRRKKHVGKTYKPDAPIKVDGLWCSSCRKTRAWKEIYFIHYLWKGAWWRKSACTWCDDILRDEPLE